MLKLGLLAFVFALGQQSILFLSDGAIFTVPIGVTFVTLRSYLILRLLSVDIKNGAADAFI